MVAHPRRPRCIKYEVKEKLFCVMTANVRTMRRKFWRREGAKGALIKECMRCGPQLDGTASLQSHPVEQQLLSGCQRLVVTAVADIGADPSDELHGPGPP